MTTASSRSQARRRAGRPGCALHGLRGPLLPQRLPTREPDPRLERPRLQGPFRGRHRPAPRDQQLPRVHGPPVPGAVRGGVRARDPRGRGRHDQTDRELDHQPGVAGGLGQAAPAAARERPVGGGGRFRSGGHGCGPAAAQGGPQRDAVRARRGDWRPRALRRTGLQDREDSGPAPRRAADRRGRGRALRRGCGNRRQRRGAQERFDAVVLATGRVFRATFRSRAASSTACTSRWSTCISAIASSHGSTARRRRPQPPSSGPSALRARTSS